MVEICPLATNWGTIAEWVTAIVATVTGAAVWRLGSKANNIATSAQDVADRERQREARVILLHISSDVAHSLATAIEMQRELTSPLIDALFLSDPDYRRRLANRTGELNMPTVEKMVPRLHVLASPEGDALARAIGTQRTLGRAAHFAINGHPDDLLDESYKKLLTTVAGLADDLAIVDRACKQSTLI
jgi:hypothetical protein